MTGYRIQPRVAAALEHIHGYWTDRWGEQCADAYILGFFELFERIAAREITWRPIPTDLDAIGFRHRYQRHLVYWRSRSDGTVIIFAVLHERMHQFERLKFMLEDDPGNYDL